MIALSVTEVGDVGLARRRAVQEAQRAGIGTNDQERLALIVTEMATNLVRHAQAGEIILVPDAKAPPAAMHVIAVDSGPGIADVEAALRDGFTTVRGAGAGIGGGLGSIRRLSDAFDIYSCPGGTTVVSTLLPLGKSSSAVEVGGLIVPKPGFDRGGDAFAVRFEAGFSIVLLVDVLGHGPTAAEMAEDALVAFEGAVGCDLERTEAMVSRALSGGRGAAALLAALPAGEGPMQVVGLGNVRGEIIMPDGSQHGIPSAPGIMGGRGRPPRSTEHDWPFGATLVLTTDGLRNPKRMPEQPALYSRQPLTLAATLYKRRRRGADDSGIVIARRAP